jgi:hypothetical protein
MDEETPPRPDGRMLPIEAPPRRKTPAALVLVIVVSVLVFLGMVAVAVNAVLDNEERSVRHQFERVQYCVDHPHDPTCALPSGSP